MVNFHRAAGVQWVANEDDAYRYWMHTLSAGLMAERAYAPTVVHRVRYAGMIDDPKSTMRSLLEFLEEAYTERCVEPLELRINSSTVPTDSETDNTAVGPAVVDEAMQLSAKVERPSQPAEASSTAADEMEAAFQ